MFSLYQISLMVLIVIMFVLVKMPSDKFDKLVKFLKLR